MELELTPRAREAVRAAARHAADAGHLHVTPVHLLLALAEDSGAEQERTTAQDLLAGAPGDLDELRKRIGELLAGLPADEAEGADEPDPDASTAPPEVARGLLVVFSEASQRAHREGGRYVDTATLLLALAAKDSRSAQLLAAAGLTAEDLERRGASADTEPSEPEGGDPAPRPAGHSATPAVLADDSALSYFGTDLTEEARRGRLDPVIGRDAEIRQLIEVLNRRTKSNPVLIGEPGVGKTAVVEGLAQRIVAGDVPESLRDTVVVSLDIAALLAGTGSRGAFEGRMREVLAEIEAARGRIIPFIDEVHTVVGAGSRKDSAVDAGNILKPRLARGGLRLIGATTREEYRLRIETDPALERRLQPVAVAAPSLADTVAILRGLKGRYEAHHRVQITDAALVAAVALADRFLPYRHLPDKAVDLLDQAASRVRTEIDSVPAAIDDLGRRVDRLRMEVAALERETDSASDGRLRELAAELAENLDQRDRMVRRWTTERTSARRIGTLKGRLEELKAQADEAQRKGDFAAAGRLLYKEIPDVQTELRELAAAVPDDGAEKLFRHEVDPDAIADVLASWTGIPVGRLLAGESEALLTMEAVLARRVVGQRQALRAVSDAVRRSRSGLGNPRRPIGSFLFTGPSGVGKTELAKALAEFLFQDERALIRIDMTEYADKHSVTRLVGAAPGYVGYKDGGQLTEAVRTRPYSVVLFDEVEKADRTVFGILLQVLSDARLTDSQGRTVDFRNTLLILTAGRGDTLPPEFLNRLDQVVPFQPLVTEELLHVADLHLTELAQRLADRRINLEIAPQALPMLLGYERSTHELERNIREKVVDVVARSLLNHTVVEGDTVILERGLQGSVRLRTRRGPLQG
ncbi:ATP-dependent chaperone ClpB [Streptomyces albus subsp. albus]|nr:ATP-dependent chaperone ClpB [Streptomyces albus subsp. albus]